MKYFDGREVRLGDKVQLWNGCFGIVVCSIDTNEYMASYPKEEWQYLKTGIIVRTDKAGLVHLIQADEDFQFIESKKP